MGVSPIGLSLRDATMPHCYMFREIYIYIDSYI